MVRKQLTQEEPMKTVADILKQKPPGTVSITPHATVQQFTVRQLESYIHG